MLGSEPNVTHCASWQQPCHSGVYSSPALLVTCQHSHQKRHVVNPLDGNSSIRVCMGKCVRLRSLTEIREQTSHTFVHTPPTSCRDAHPTYSFIKFTPCSLVCIVLQHPSIHWSKHTHTHTPLWVHCRFKHALPFRTHRRSCDLALGDHWPVFYLMWFDSWTVGGSWWNTVEGERMDQESHRTALVGGEEWRGKEEDLRSGVSSWSKREKKEGGASPLMRGTSSRAQAHFLFLKVNRQPAGVWGVMGKEETVMLIRPVHTSPSNNITKQELKHGKATDNREGIDHATAMVWSCTIWW